MGLYPVNNLEVQKDSCAGCWAGCLPGVIGALILAAAEAMMASHFQRVASYEFVPFIIFVACLVSWLQHQFRPLGAQPSAGCAWVVIVLMVAWFIFAAASDSRTPSVIIDRW